MRSIVPSEAGETAVVHRRVLRPAVIVAVFILAIVPDLASAMQLAETRPGRPLVIAHRGYSGIAPEHTIASYDLAHRAGADYLEQDLQMTADGVLVALHDATLDRTARGRGAECTGSVISKSLDEVLRCDVGSWFNERNPNLAREEYAGLRVPTLAEVFARYGASARYYIETKNPEEAPGMEEALLRLLREHELLERSEGPPRVVIQSFSAESLRKLRSLEPGLFLVQLFERMSPEELGERLPGIASYARGIGPHFSSVDEGIVRAAHDAGLVVHPYTVNDSDEMRRLRTIGVDGFFTDQTERAFEVLGS